MGVVIAEEGTGRRTEAPVRLVERLDPNDRYDVVMVPVRRKQVDSVLPTLSAAERIPSVLFMQNHGNGSPNLARAVGRERLLLGFPGAAGYVDNGVVRCRLIPQQPTTLGEPDGSITDRLHDLRRALRDAGFSVAISRRMDGWLAVHAVFVTAVMGAL